MTVYLLFAVSLICLVIADDLQTNNQPKEISTGKDDDDGQVTKDQICNSAKDASVRSAYVAERLIQLFIENSDGSKGWTAETTALWPGDKYPLYRPQSSRRDRLGKFWNVDKIRDSEEHENDSTFKRVSASFHHFSYGFKDKGYLVLGISAHEFEIGNDVYGPYYPTGNVKLITDFFKDGEKKLLLPEDKLEEVVSVALIKWVEKDKIKDHAIYKIILKTVTKKLVKSYFKLNSSGDVISLNSEPFVPSVELLQDKDEFDLLEESALYNVREKNELSMGYQFTSKFAFPIYYEYNPETNTYIEYPMKTKTGFNTDLETLADKIPYSNRYIVPTETWLGCPETTFCLGRTFDAVFFAGNNYYAIYGDLVYTLDSINTTPGTGVSLRSLSSSYDVNAAFAIGAKTFLIRYLTIDYVTNITNIGEENAETLSFGHVFPDIFPESVLAVITLEKENEAAEVKDNKPEPSKLKSAALSQNHRSDERAAQTMEDDIHKMIIYVFTMEARGIVYQYQIETMKPPKFKLVTKKAFSEVNSALPMKISMAFIAEDKVVTMVHHFMIEQSSQTFFTQTENAGKFTLVDKYFGCQSENLENKLTKEFVQNYLEFAGPKPASLAFTDTHKEPESTTDKEGVNVKGRGSLVQTSIACFVIQAVVTILVHEIMLNEFTKV